VENLMLEKNIRVCDLFDIYGKFLSEKQQKFVKEYFFLDNSLSEIAENWGVSRQAVLDSLATSQTKLEEFEKKLSLLKIKELLQKLDAQQNNEQIINMLKNLI
jgi:predicted DNA-binding protein YlxM (UPF0122 family)